MSTNAYRSEQRIYFRGDGRTPSIFYGYYVSYSGGSDEVHPFDSVAEQRDFERVVVAATGDGGVNYPLLLAATCALYLWGGESEAEYAWWALENREGEVVRDRVLEAGEKWRDKANGIEREA